MSLRAMLHRVGRPPHPLPRSILAIEDIQGVRVIRLPGSVGRDVGAEADGADSEAAKTEGVFGRPVLFDFKETTDVDSATVAYLVRALRRRLAAHMPVGIVNAPPLLAAELEITRVGPLLLVFRSEDEAVRELAARAATLKEHPGS